jgi:type II secretory pathway component PulK
MKHSKQGGALIFTLWVIVFLSLTALSLGQRTRVGLSFTQAHVGEVKAKALAWAGMINAIDLIREGTLNDPQKSRGRLAEGSFEIVYQDQEEKINLNALGPNEASVLLQLALLSGVTEDQAGVLSEKAMKHLQEGGRFQSIEDLALVSGVTVQENLRNVLTVFPRSAAGLKINVNTASAPVLKALARGIRTESELSVQDSDRLIDKMLSFRAGEDEKDHTADDKIVDFSAMILDTREEMMARKLSRYQSMQSEYVSILSRGTYGKSIVVFEAVLYRPALAIVAWRKLE